MDPWLSLDWECWTSRPREAFPARCSRRSRSSNFPTSSGVCPARCEPWNETLRSPGIAGVGSTLDLHNRAVPKLPALLRGAGLHLGDFIPGKIQVFELPFWGSWGLRESRSREFPLGVHPLPGYTVSSVVSAEHERIYVAGAPRFNHTGKVILFSMHGNRNLTIHQALKGEQVIPAEFPPWKIHPLPVGFLSSFLPVRAGINARESQFLCLDSVFVNSYLWYSLASLEF